ncbi:MAG: hypothetical protein KKE52_03215 [Alphaproteobacteria bacterium]|nr:hypothetical protein [Alphaproteobacteria bacterium]MBU2270290.1 hypothetical protein [Alphaproteobacteria bacterium]
MSGILLSFIGTAHLNRAVLTFGALYIAGSAVVSFAAFRTYRWLGPREPSRNTLDGDERSP